MDASVRHVLTSYRTWAVVGWSPSPHRDSHRIAGLLESHGYRVLRVNPNCTDRDGVYASLHDLGEPVEVVDLFRRSACVAAHAAERARAAGLEVVVDRCPALELPHLIGSSSR